MRILIADDEHLARVMVHSMIDEIDDTIEVAEAINGRDLIDKALQFIPHLIVVDIQMPLMSGLDAMKRIKESLPLTKWVILTGFAHFDYAKEAVMLHAYEYLLKPVRIEKLKEIIARSRSQNIKDVCSRNAAFEQQMKSYFQFSKKNSLEFACYQLAVFSTYESRDRLPFVLSKIMADAQNIIVDDMEFLARGAVLPMNETSCCIVAASNDRKILDKLFLPVLHKIHDHCLNSTWCIYDEVLNDSELITFSLDKCKRAGFLKSFLPPEEIISSDSVLVRPNYAQLKAVSDLLWQAEVSGEQGRVIYARELLETAVTKAMELRKENRTDLFHLLRYLFKQVHSGRTFPDENISSDQICEELESFLLLIREKSSTLVKDVLSYIRNHYNEPISVKGIASIMKISPNYLSAKFKNETGKRFVEYLSEIRIEEAKIRLSHTHMHINEIAKAVGVHDVRYFTELFRKYENCTPSEYRNRAVK